MSRALCPPAPGVSAHGLRAMALAALALGASCGARTDLGRAPEDGETLDPSCGDGLVGGEEACDDANEALDDACVACAVATCGDGFVRAGFEACDPGDDPACTERCALASCGDGVLEGAEECDDGNAVETDACPSGCIAARCGDGVVEEGVEECDDGAANDDRPALYVIQGEVVQPVQPVLGGVDVTTFYAHDSASAHTGFETRRESHLFLYLAPDGTLSLLTIHGIDEDATGISTGEGEVVQTFEGLPGGTYVAHADDNTDEFDLTSPSTALGDWWFRDNTDGGVLSGLPWPGAWTITIRTDLDVGIDTWGVIVPDGVRHLLDATREAILVSRIESTGCRDDCTYARCGDGRLDGGESCDDGNTASGDGCSPACTPE